MWWWWVGGGGQISTFPYFYSFAAAKSTECTGRSTMILALTSNKVMPPFLVMKYVSYVGFLEILRISFGLPFFDFQSLKA